MHAQKIDRPNAEAAQNCGVINPYALAEVVAGRPIAWRQVADRRRLLEGILQTPYEELFDPVYGGPLYMGLALDRNGRLVRVRPPLLDVEVTLGASDLDGPPQADLSAVRRLSDLAQHFAVEDVGAIEVARVEPAEPGRLRVMLRLPEGERLRRLARVFPRAVIETVAFDPKAERSKDWNPPGGRWSDAGRFFNEAAEFFDPIQGAVANCYYIAALSAVAWAMPYRISHLARATGPAQQVFTNMIRFYNPDSGGAVEREIEVTDAVPVSASGSFIYCRSSEAGEIWPAVYEKAFAKLVTGVSGDQPDVTATAWGDCVMATARLTGGTRSYYDTAGRSADALWDLVRSNSLGGRTFNPMTAWTYSSGEATERKVVYSDANIVASHCYAVLGWDYRDGRKYIILRNPWGNTEATVGVLAGTAVLFDISWWRPIALADVDGTFAIEASAFRTYFAGLGVAK